jgi:archaellum component FlaC
MSSEADTLPTIQTVLDAIAALRSEVSQRFDAVERRLSVIERQLENMDIRLDGIESFAHQTRSEILALRKDFKEFKLQTEEANTQRTT